MEKRVEIDIDTAQASIDALATELDNLKKRAEVLNQSKLAAKAEVDMLKKQWAALQEEAKQLGIADTKNLGQAIKESEQKLELMIQELSDNLAQMESLVNARS